MSQPKATVIGASGFIGQALAANLHAEGWAVFTPARGTLWPNDTDDLGHVFYCAGLTADYLVQPHETAEAHVGLLSRVLRSRHYTSLVYLSSTRVYDGLAPDQMAHEEALVALGAHVPRHLYDLTKLTGESLCHAMAPDRARVARLSCVYDTAPTATGFLPELLAAVCATPPGETLKVSSTPHAARDYVHIADVVRALKNIAQRGSHAVYNVASGHNLGNGALAQWIAATAQRHIAFGLSHTPPNPAPILVNRLSAEFGWHPKQVEACVGPWLIAQTKLP